MDNCVFCKIINKELPSTSIYEDNNTLVFKTIEPAAEHHYLVVPKTHIASFVDLGDQIKDMMRALQEVIKKLNLSSGYKLILNGGKYQEVMHVHWHILAGKLESESDILNRV